MSLILVVDDDPTVRLIAGELLNQDEHALLFAADGDEALRTLAVAPVDLMILDMLMPNKDGVETLIAARAHHPELRVLAMSAGGGMAAVDLLRMARAFGADETYVKPLRLDTFAATVERLLTGTGPAAREGGRRPGVGPGIGVRA